VISEFEIPRIIMANFILKGNENDPRIKKLMAALHSPEIIKFIQEKYQGAIVPAF